MRLVETIVEGQLRHSHNGSDGNVEVGTSIPAELLPSDTPPRHTSIFVFILRLLLAYVLAPTILGSVFLSLILFDIPSSAPAWSIKRSRFRKLFALLMQLLPIGLGVFCLVSDASTTNVVWGFVAGLVIPVVIAAHVRRSALRSPTKQFYFPQCDTSYQRSFIVARITDTIQLSVVVSFIVGADQEFRYGVLLGIDDETVVPWIAVALVQVFLLSVALVATSGGHATAQNKQDVVYTEQSGAGAVNISIGTEPEVNLPPQQQHSNFQLSPPGHALRDYKPLRATVILIGDLLFVQIVVILMNTIVAAVDEDESDVNVSTALRWAAMVSLSMYVPCAVQIVPMYLIDSVVQRARRSVGGERTDLKSWFLSVHTHAQHRAVTTACITAALLYPGSRWTLFVLFCAVHTMEALYHAFHGVAGLAFGARVVFVTHLVGVTVASGAALCADYFIDEDTTVLYVVWAAVCIVFWIVLVVVSYYIISKQSSTVREVSVSQSRLTPHAGTSSEGMQHQIHHHHHIEMSDAIIDPIAQQPGTASPLFNDHKHQYPQSHHNEEELQQQSGRYTPYTGPAVEEQQLCDPATAQHDAALYTEPDVGDDLDEGEAGQNNNNTNTNGVFGDTAAVATTTRNDEIHVDLGDKNGIDYAAAAHHTRATAAAEHTDEIELDLEEGSSQQQQQQQPFPPQQSYGQNNTNNSEIEIDLCGGVDGDGGTNGLILEGDGDAADGLPTAGRSGSKEGSYWNATDDQEDPSRYCVGGYHAVQPGEVFGGKYKAVVKLGWGEFSTVWLARDVETQTFVALKISRADEDFRGASLHENDAYEVLNQTLVKYEQGSPPIESEFIMRMFEYFEHTGPHGTHIVTVAELLGPNLLKLITVHEFRGIEIDIVRVVIRQVLLGLTFLHSHGIVHSDIKPENILLVSPTENVMRAMMCVPDSEITEADIVSVQNALRGVYTVAEDEGRMEALFRHYGAKISDLGSARYTNRQYPVCVVQTREYRAPEVLLGYADIGTGADLWSVACMTFELITGDFLFDPKVQEDYDKDVYHFTLMRHMLGEVPTPFSICGTLSPEFFATDGRFLGPDMESTTIAQHAMENYGVPEEEAVALEQFLLPMLMYDPTQRATAKEMLSHPWLSVED
eukprot:PhM_4_TR18659/c0_g1_i1/m.75826/K08832/SRPK3, STK23; serine/threonine-protein kinase SRPK3